jgi:flagellar FliJ protein
MRAFAFKLEKVLKLRVSAEEEARNGLGRAVGALSAIENNIRANEAERAAAARERFASADGNAIDRFRLYEAYIERLDADAERMAEEAAEAELVVDEARTAYVAASRDRKIIDKLQERDFQEYRKRSFKAEEKALDDVKRS